MANKLMKNENLQSNTILKSFYFFNINIIAVHVKY